MADDAPFLPGLSPVSGKAVHLAFDGGRLTSDAGVVLLAEIERKLQIAERLARCVADPRAPERVRHGLAEMIRFRALLIAAGYPDANDCDALRDDPAFKMAVGRLPETGAELCSQPTMSRLENLPTKTTLIRMTDAPRQPPGRLRFADRSDRLLTVDLSSCSATASPRCHDASSSTSTIRSTGCTAISSCPCSMRITTAAAFSRSTSTRQ